MLTYNDLSEEVERREDLESELRRLQRRAVEVHTQIRSIKPKRQELKYEVKAQEHLKSIRGGYEDRAKGLNRLSGLIDDERRNQRRRLQSQLSGIMDSMIEEIEEGIFADATSVSFPNPDNYHFTVHTPRRRYESSKAERESTEAAFQSLIFHSAVIKHLSEKPKVAFQFDFL